MSSLVGWLLGFPNRMEYHTLLNHSRGLTALNMLRNAAIPGGKGEGKNAGNDACSDAQQSRQIPDMPCALPSAGRQLNSAGTCSRLGDPTIGPVTKTGPPNRNRGLRAASYLNSVRAYRDVRLYLVTAFVVGFTVFGGMYTVLNNLYVLRLAMTTAFIGLMRRATLIVGVVGLPAAHGGVGQPPRHDNRAAADDVAISSSA